MTGLPIPDMGREPTHEGAIRRKRGRPRKSDTLRDGVPLTVHESTGSDRLMTSTQVSARLGITRHMANRLMRTNGFAGVVHVGTVVLVKASVLEEWLLALG